MASQQVKAWTYKGPSYPEALRLSTTSVPSTPPPHHVLVKVHAASINPVDIQLINVPQPGPAAETVKLVARDFSGTVVAASPESGLSENTEICGIIPDFTGKTGTLTEIACFDVRTAVFIEKPPQFSHSQAASLPLVYLTARTSIEKCVPYLQSSTTSDNKLVILGGSSATGLYTVKLAHARGWTVLSSCSGRNTDFVKSLGANQVVDYTTSPTAVVDAVRAFEPDAIIDCVGGTEAIGLARQYITIVGDKTSRSTMGGSALYKSYPRMVLRWFLGYIGVANSYECIILEGKKEWLEEIKNLKADEVVIDSTFKFEKTKEAFERLDSGRCRGKVVIEMK